MYFIIVDRKQEAVCAEYQDALADAAQLDHMFNSPELNDGVQGNHKVEILSFMEMMEADDVEMVI